MDAGWAVARFQRNDQLWRAARDGSGATPLPNTDLAYEPAISPNGQWLAFSRNTEGDDRSSHLLKPYDLWAVSF